MCQMKKATLNKILSNSGLIKEAGLEFETPKKKQNDGLDLSFDDTPAGNEDSAVEDSTDSGEESNDAVENDAGDDISDASPREKLHKLMEPQVEIAKQVMTSVSNAYADIKTKKYKEMLDQLKNFEKQLRGACQQVIAQANNIGFDTTDNTICSPKAFKTISQYESRDRSVLEMVAAIIVFSNSLT